MKTILKKWSDTVEVQMSCIPACNRGGGLNLYCSTEGFEELRYIIANCQSIKEVTANDEDFDIAETLLNFCRDLKFDDDFVVYRIKHNNGQNEENFDVFIAYYPI